MAREPTPDEAAQAATVAAAQRDPDAQRLHADVKRALFDPSAPAEEPGRILAGRYRLIAFLGEGGMGRVWRAHDLVLDEEVAIKFLPRRLAQSQAHLERFVREVRIARQVSHSNVCRVHDISSVDEHPFLSMEYIDGGDLDALLRRIGRLERDKALALTHELCSGLAALHERGILHRDLKPANVMIDGRGHVRITDFGLAALHEELGAAEVRDGTPAYQAPEQAAGREVSVRSDVYALGVLLFEMFSGRRWLDVPGTASERAVEAEAMLRPIDPEVAVVVGRCLEVDPEQRPRSVLAVAASLPGGDPLAAAIAAGRLPSPEAVANARGVGGLPTRWAIAALVATAILVFASTILRAQASGLGEEVLPPDVLMHRAETLIAQAGHSKSSCDARFAEFDHAYIAAVEREAPNDHDPDPPGLARRLRAKTSSPLVWTYRAWPCRPPGGLQVTPDDPAPTTHDARVTLDASGRLLHLRVIPTEKLEPPSDPPDVADFAPLLTAIDPDPESVVPGAVRRRPDVHVDEHVAHDATVGVTPVHIELAALRGRPVWVSVDRTTSPDAEAPTPRQTAGVARTAGAAVMGLVLVGLLIAWAVHTVLTLKRPQGDAVAARRLAYTVALFQLSAFLLQAESMVDVFNIHLLQTTVFTWFSFWITYLIVEPFARRRLPRSLIAWNRLVRGRWSDPMVGRDILLGCAGGMLLALAPPVYQLASGDGHASFEPSTLLGVRFAVSTVLHMTLAGANLAMTLYMVLALAEAVLRRHWAALTMVVGIISLGTLLSVDEPRWALLAAVLVIPCVLFVFRFGLLTATVLSTVVALVLSFPSPLAGPWATVGLVPLVVVAVLAVFGYVHATAPQRVAATASSHGRRA